MDSPKTEHHFTCTHGNPVRPGSAFTFDQCRLCWIAVGGDVSAEPIQHIRRPVAARKSGCSGCPPTVKTTLTSLAQVDHLREVLRDPGRTPEGEGSGIIYVGGGRYWPGIAVGCRLIRELGCEWPIEVWYRGECEEVYPEDVRGLDVTLIDADAMSVRLGDNRVPRGQREWGGWEAKSYAFTHTGLNRFLYLDADAYCVLSPCQMFGLLERRPFVFWSDLPNQRGTINWTAVLPEAETVGQGLPPVQGGQLLIDRPRAWPMIAALHHICQHSDHYWPSPETRLLYGDQDAWRVGMADGAAPWLHLGNARWDRVAFVCEWEGKPRIVHRCQSKLYGPEFALTPRENGQQHASLPLEGRVHDLLAEVLHRRTLSPEAVFSTIYERGLWMGGSGEGSGKAEGEPYLRIINALAAERGWTSCVDVGCGDGRIAKGLTFASYVGVDVVPGQAVSIAADCYHDLSNLPAADVLLAKDVLMHWPNEWVSDWLARLQSLINGGRWKAAILTQDRGQLHDGQNTHLGGFRGLDPKFQPLSAFNLTLHANYLHKSVLVMGAVLPPG